MKKAYAEFFCLHYCRVCYPFRPYNVLCEEGDYGSRQNDKMVVPSPRMFESVVISPYIKRDFPDVALGSKDYLDILDGPFATYAILQAGDLCWLW